MAYCSEEVRKKSYWFSISLILEEKSSSLYYSIGGLNMLWLYYFYEFCNNGVMVYTTWHDFTTRIGLLNMLRDKF